MEVFDKDLQSIQEARECARKTKVAQKEFAFFTEAQVDRILCAMVKAAEDNAERLARMAVEETGFGKVVDKITKNKLASTILYRDIKDLKVAGVIKNDTVKKVTEIAVPVGVLFGIIPSTNPTSTVIFKAIAALKARNGIIFSPHPSAKGCTGEAARLMAEAAESAGAPKDIITWVTMPSMAATNELLHAPEVNMIIATGGEAMVRAAYSSGKPALGVGPGNGPSFIEHTADIPNAVRRIIASKTFDYGTVCASEQSIVVEESIAAQVEAEFKAQGCYFMTDEETKAVCKILFKNGFAMNAKFVGRPPQVIADAAGITIPAGTKILLGRQQGVGAVAPLSYEKLTTVLGYYVVKDWHEACELCMAILENCGTGHTMTLHTQDPEIPLLFSIKPVNRLLVNTSGTQGGTGACTGLFPSFTLGCGTQGGSATSDNVSPLNLINIKRIAYGLEECYPTDEVASPKHTCTTSASQVENIILGSPSAAVTVGCGCGDTTVVGTLPKLDEMVDDTLRQAVEEVIAMLNKG